MNKGHSRDVSREDEGCLFALGRSIYGWHPGMAVPKLLAERPRPISSLDGGYCWGETSGSFLWDACLDGYVRRNLGEDVEDRFEEPVWAVIWLHCDFLDPEYQLACRKARRDGSYQPPPDQPVLLYLIGEIGGEGILRFVDSHLRFHQSNCLDYSAPVQAIALDSEYVFWMNCGVVYRGLDNSAIDGNFRAEHTLLLPFGMNFFIRRYTNDYFYPEGVVISARDRRTVLSWDPLVYGFGHCVGIYQHQNRPWLFFYSIHWGEKVVGYTMPFRSPDGRHLPEPRQVFDWPFDREEHVDIGSNPFLAVKIGYYGHLFQ